MDMKQATAVVVEMAQARPAETIEGEALRMILRDLKEQRLLNLETERAAGRMAELMDKEAV